MTQRPPGGLHALLAAELSRPAPPEAEAIASAILARHGAAVAAILFYGSCRRDADGSGLLDVYALYDDARAYHRGALAGPLTRLLPPHVSLLRASADGRPAVAKVAALSRRQFSRRMRAASLDTTVWARFCQPSTLLYARDPNVRRWVTETLAFGLWTAARWAMRLGPAAEDPAACWQRLFARTYQAELRPERKDRPGLVYQAYAGWFDQALSLVRADMPPLSRTQGRLWRLAWLCRRLWGKPLNVARLAKAALTFESGTDYVLWKLERHSGVRIVASDWQRRHPLLAAPGLLWQLKTRR